MVSKEWELQSGLKFNLEVPSTVEEFDALPGGRVGLCLECGVDDVMYRGPFADVRDALAAALETAYPKAPRERKPHPNADRAKKGETVINESPGKYINRLVALQGWDDATGFQPILDGIMKTSNEVKARIAAGDATVTSKEKEAVIEFSVEKVARTGSGSLIPKVDLETAATILADAGRLPTVLTKLGGFLADESGEAREIVLTTVDGDAQATYAAQQKQIALLLKEYRSRLAKQQMAALVAA
jgi:hypothetical protein